MSGASSRFSVNSLLNHPRLLVPTDILHLIGRICYPALGRVTRVKNSPVQLLVTFVEGAPTQPENVHTSDLARSPEPLNTILAFRLFQSAAARVLRALQLPSPVNGQVCFCTHGYRGFHQVLHKR